MAIYLVRVHGDAYVSYDTPKEFDGCEGKVVLGEFDEEYVLTQDSEDSVQVMYMLSCIRTSFIELSKCDFALTIKFLRHIITDRGITMDPAKIKATFDWPPPSGTPVQCKAQPHVFLGLANFCRRPIDHFAGPAAPLNELTTQTSEWTWRIWCCVVTATCSRPHPNCCTHTQCFVTLL